MAGTIVVDRIESDSSYTSTINVASKVNFTGGMQIGGQDSMLSGMRNRIINGAMRIDQRNSGSSVSHLGNASAVIYPVDRTFGFNNTGTANTTLTMQRVAVTANIGFDYAVRATIGNTTSRVTYDGRYQQNIEGNNVADYIMGVTTMVVTFWARASKTGYAYYSIWSSNAGTGAYFYKRISLTTDWQKFTIPIPACTVPGADVQKNHNRGFGSGLYWAQAGWQEALDGQWATAAQVTGQTARDDFSASGDWIEFTGYQLEYGTTPTSFEFRSHEQELALCKRYFTVFPPRNGGNLLWTVAYLSSYVYATALIPHPMRTTPTPTDPTSGSSTVSSGAGNLYALDGTGTSARTSSGTQPALSCSGFSDSPTVYMIWSGATQPTSIATTFASCSFNGGSPGIFLSAEM